MSKNLIRLHEAVVLALINEPMRTANYEKIAGFISKRNLFTNRKGNVSLETQIMLRCTKSNGAYGKYFEDLGAGFIHLKDSDAYFPLKIMTALEMLLNFDTRFYAPNSKKLSVVKYSHNSKETMKISLNPENIVCIHSVEKSRKKLIYTIEKDPSKGENIVCYNFNNNSYNFEKLCSYLDPISGYLVQVSRSTIINVAYFKLISNHKLSCLLKSGKSNMPKVIEVSRKKSENSMLKNFILVKEAHTRRVLLQNTVLGYKNEALI